jgi:hypothetical protein
VTPDKRISSPAYRRHHLSQRGQGRVTRPESEFSDLEVPVPGGGATRMKLPPRQTGLTAGTTSIRVLEHRRLTQTGHQTAIITTTRGLHSPVVAGRMFSRRCQEDFFGYMVQHYDIEGVVQCGGEEIPGTVEVVD